MPGVYWNRDALGSTGGAWLLSVSNALDALFPAAESDYRRCFAELYA